MLERLSLPAIVTGAVVAAILNLMVGLAAPNEGLESLYNTAIIAALGGFVAYLIGGYIAGRMAGGHGGLNGIVAVGAGFLIGTVIGIVQGVIMTSTGASPNDMDPSSLDISAEQIRRLIIGSIIAFGSFLMNFVIGYFAGKLGERSSIKAG